MFGLSVTQCHFTLYPLRSAIIIAIAIPELISFKYHMLCQARSNFCSNRVIMHTKLGQFAI